MKIASCLVLCASSVCAFQEVYEIDTRNYGKVTEVACDCHHLFSPCSCAAPLIDCGKWLLLTSQGKWLLKFYAPW
jgi:hypothetical protein